MSASTISGSNNGLIDDILDLDSRDGMESQGQSYIISVKSSDSEDLNKLQLDFEIVKNERNTQLMTVNLIREQLKQNVMKLTT